MITLKEITRDNFDHVIDLSLSEEQRSFVASNTYSIAQAKIFPELVPQAIYNDEELVGFLMYGVDPDDKEYWIARLMIDQRFQQLGYGKAAMKLALSEISQFASKVYLSFEPENTGAKHLYEQLGFQPDGRVIEGEIVYFLQFEPN